MSDPQTQAAIDAALKNNWQQALDINSEILKNSPEDIDCMNRLGKAYLELGNNKKATTIFKEVLKLNQYDPIATKNLLRATQSTTAHVKKGKNTNPLPSNFTSVSFLEEPGKTKVISLVNVAPTKTLLSLRCADQVLLVSKRHAILAETSEGIYLGALPDDLGHRLLVLTKGGNEYEAYVKSVSKGLLVLFIKEKSRSKKFKSTPSFPSGSSDYLSFVREDGHEEVEATATGEAPEDEDEAAFKKTEKLHQDEEVEET